MPNIRSAAKRVRADRKRRMRNLEFQSELKTLTKKVQQAFLSKVKDQANALFRKLATRLDQAASKGIVHRNTASRRKSRLAHRLAHL